MWISKKKWKQIEERIFALEQKELQAIQSSLEPCRIEINSNEVSQAALKAN